MAKVYRQSGKKRGEGVYMTRMRLLGARRVFSLEVSTETTALRRRLMLEDLPHLPVGAQALRLWWEQKQTLPRSQRSVQLADLYEAWSSRDRESALEALVFRLRDTDLQEHAAIYLQTIPNQQDSPGYWLARSVRLLLGDDPMPASLFTVSRVEDWLNSLPMSPSSRRLYYHGVRRFGAWLVRRGTIPSNPVTQVPRPKAKAPEIRFLELPEIARVIAAAANDTDRLAFLLAYGAGIERVGLLRIRRRDFHEATRSVQVRGATGKGASRERVCRIDAWAWEQIWPLIRTMLPDTLLLDGMSPASLSLAHLGATRACHLDDRKTTLHCARHAWAVRWLRVGVPVEMVARQLGHANGKMVHTVYGRFLPTTADWERWEQVAGERQTLRTGTQAGTRDVG